MAFIPFPEPLLLASASPRRLDSLRSLGFSVECAPADADENVYDYLPIRERVVALASLKVRAGAAVADAALADAAANADGRSGNRPAAPRYALGADTLVSVDGEAFGKPADEDDARRMILALAGRSHLVSTGLAVLDRLTGAVETGLSETTVSFAPLERGELEWYLSSGEWSGVAGGYRIQGLAALLVRRIEGSFSGVVGLPLHTFYDILSRIGYPLPFGSAAD